MHVSDMLVIDCFMSSLNPSNFRITYVADNWPDWTLVAVDIRQVYGRLHWADARVRHGGSLSDLHHLNNM